jgi:hypothetical protein
MQSNMNSETKNCQNCKQDFTIESGDFAFYEKMKVPAPTWCSECRMKRRFAWRNEHNLYKRKDDRTGEEIFSGFPQAAPIKVYEKEYWISDAFDAMEYGKDYDFSKPFFEQFKELAYQVPWPSRSVLNNVNSEYADQTSYLKNCYLCFSIDDAEDSAYVVRAAKIKKSFDLTQVTDVELCYEGISLNGCYKTFFSENCDSCIDVWLSKNCVGCTNCFGCANLRNKSYCFFNEQLSKKEYQEKLEAFNLHTQSGLRLSQERVKNHLIKFPVKYFRGLRVIDSMGDYLRNTKDVTQSWFIEDGQAVKYGQNLYNGAKDSYDYSVWGNDASFIYECLTCGEQINNLKFCFDCWPACRELEYSISCRSSSNLFGCVGLKKKQYCIFNKQYSKEEYLTLREKIIAHMNEMSYKNTKGHVYRYGDFFPEEFSPFAYNETQLIDFWPLLKEDAIDKGYSWREPETREYKITIPATQLPDSTLETPETITKEVIACELCNKAYRIMPNEFVFLKQAGIALPRNCVNCRFSLRSAKINKPFFYSRQCMCDKTNHSHPEKCQVGFETSYAPERPEIVYCEQCYQKEVV